MTTPPHADQWVTISRAAHLLGVTRPTVYAMIARGELEAERVAERLAVRRDAVADAIRERRAAEG